MTKIEFVLSQQRELGDVTGNLSQIKQRLKKIENLDEKSQVRLRFSICSVSVLLGHNIHAYYTLPVLSI